MLVKISKEVEYKLSFISSKSKLKSNKLIERIFLGFFQRYEDKSGRIPERRVGRRGSEVYRMYQVFKDKYKLLFNEDYVADEKQSHIDMRNLKNIKEKIMMVSMLGENSDVIAISEDDLVNAFGFLLDKMSDWWKANQFKITSINKNFEKIVHQIKFSKTDKDVLDDFIEGLNILNK